MPSSTISYPEQAGMPADQARSWLGFHLFYDGNLDLVITDLVSRIVTRLDTEGAATGLFYLRYWEGGPHVRIRVLPTPGAHADVSEIVTVAAADFLTRHPAPSLVTQSDYASYASAYAALEGKVCYEQVRRPNNSVAAIGYRPETHKYGTGAALHAVEDHFVACSTAVRHLLTAGLTAPQRSTTAFAVLALAWWIGLCWGEPPARPDRRPGAPADREPAALAGSYERQRDALVRLAATMRTVAELPSPDGPPGTFEGWAKSLVGLAQRIGEPEETWRVLDNCAHLACNRLGVLPEAEGELRYLGYRAFAELLPERSPS